MAPMSPTMAFGPTPALEHNKENYSPFGCPNDIKPYEEDDNRNVRFSDFPTITSPVRRAQSIANPQNIPLLEPVSSASHVPRQQTSSNRFKHAVPEIDMDSYIENTRSVIEGQREGFKKEKQAFDQERKMWDAERSMLKARIADLEFKLNKSQGLNGKRRYSNDSTAAPSIDSFRSTYSSFSGPSTISSVTNSRQHSRDKEKITTPIWEGPENTTPVTRVFSNEDQKTVSHLPSISEDDALPTDGDTMSPNAGAPAVPIPIETIDSNLEGIMIKSTALAPSFVARLNSGPQSPAHSPSPRSRGEGLAMEMNNLLSPLDEKLRRNAGHTPMNFGPHGASTGGNSTGPVTPKADRPVAPTSTARPLLRPSEISDSYFSFSIEREKDVKVDELDAVEGKRRADVRRGTLSHTGPIMCEDLVNEPVQVPDEDPALQGPLMLDSSATLKSSSSFLNLVDAKLQEEIKQHPEVSKEGAHSEANVSPTNGSVRGSPGKDDFQEKQKQIEADDGMPRLKMKRSMNFGSAWGGMAPGRYLS